MLSCCSCAANLLTVCARLPKGILGPMASQQRGYVAYFNWKEHYDAVFGVNGAAHKLARTDLVPSIPALFHRLISVLQAVEKENRNRVGHLNNTLELGTDCALEHARRT